MKPQGDLKRLVSTGRSQPGGIYVDAAGTKWYLKRDTVFPELQTSADVISSKIYRHFGYQTPETSIIDVKGVRYSASRFIENTTPFSFSRELPDDAKSRAMRVVAAFLRDWDRAIDGNNLRLKDKSLLLLDFGGTLGSRAKGQHKVGVVFSDAIGSYGHTLDPVNAFDEYLTGHLPADHPWQKLEREDIRLAIRGFRSLDHDTIAAIVESAKYSNVSDKVEMVRSLFERRTQMQRFLERRLKMIESEAAEERLAIGEVLRHVEQVDSETAPPADAKPVDFKNDSEIVLYFPPKLAPRIVEHGFLNQYLSHDSSGAYDPALRLDVEDAIADRHLDTLAGERFRPKSALIIGTRSLNGIVTSYSGSGLYGGAGAVLKSKVKESAMWTYGDSLQVGQEILYGRVAPNEISRVRGTFNRTWMSSRESLPPTRRQPEFMEALIFGDLTLKDVDHFVVEYESSAAPLMALGKPVFLVTRDLSDGQQFKYKQILNFGDSAPENLPRDQREKVLNALSNFRGQASPKIR